MRRRNASDEPAKVSLPAGVATTAADTPTGSGRFRDCDCKRGEERVCVLRVLRSTTEHVWRCAGRSRNGDRATRADCDRRPPFALERIAASPEGGGLSLTVGEHVPDERIGAGRLGEDVAGEVQASVRGNRHVLRGTEARPADAEPHEVAPRIEARRNEIGIEAGAGRVAHHERATIGCSRDAKGKRLVVVRNASLPDHSPLALHAHSAIR